MQLGDEHKKKQKMSAKGLHVFDFDSLLQDFHDPTFHLTGNKVFAGFSNGTEMESKNPSVTWKWTIKFTFKINYFCI